jgi:hypothetical protein
MGLDMYLSAKRYMWYNEEGIKGDVAKAFPDLPEGIEPKEVIFEAGYWRKANAIHKWFVDNVQDGKDDCGDYWVSDENLDALLDVCKRVLEDHSLAESLLPTQSGFFFGGTGYDEYYFSDIENTVKIIERAKALVEKFPGFEIEYHSSW